MNYSSLLIGVALLSAPATAEIVDIRTQTVGTVTTNPGPGTSVFVNDAVARVYRSNGFGFGSGFAAFSAIDDRSIYFENGAMSAGAFNSSRAVTEVSLDFVNGSDVPTLEGIDSVIFESSFGFYVGEFNFLTQCSGATLPDCARVSSGVGFSDFRIAADAPMAGLAGVAFGFEVLYDGALVRRIGGSITMLQAADGTISFLEDFGSGADSLSAALNGFGLQADAGNFAYVYGWDTTPFFAAFDNLLPPGGAATVTYRITTESWSQAFNPFDSTSDNMIIGFACVRDPVGRGGGREALAPAIAALAANPDDNTCIDDVSDFRGNVLDLPRVEGGIIVFRPPVIPEPATWAMMIAGFGFVGATLRRRRQDLSVVRASL